MKMNRVVITGMGCVTPIGNNMSEFWNSILSGKSGAGPITKFDSSNFKTKFACEVKNFHPENQIPLKELRKMDLVTQYALVATEEALGNSGLKESLSMISKERIGVIYSSGIGGLQTLEEQLKEFYDNSQIPHFSPFYITKMISNMPAGTIAIRYGFEGLNYAITSACASANHALINAYNAIKLGHADIVVSGGAEASITPSAVGGFNAMKALSTRNDEPLSASRPYDVDRDGFVIGEGAGTLILENYEHALSRNAPIYAEVVGGGMSSDAYHISAPHPEGRGAILSMRNALFDAGINPSDINYINTHGTSTPAGDIPELLAIDKVFEEHTSNLYISSTKSMTGHLLGATSAIEGIVSVLSLQNGIIPPNINVNKLDPNIPKRVNIVTNKLTADINFALSNSFGFGGHNTTVIFKKYIK